MRSRIARMEPALAGSPPHLAAVTPRINPAAPLLTRLSARRIAVGGTPLPNERRPSERMDYDYYYQARHAAGEPLLFFRPMRETPRLDPRNSQKRATRPLAPRQSRQVEARAGDRAHPRGAAGSRRLPHRHRAGLRHRRRRN